MLVRISWRPKWRRNSTPQKPSFRHQTANGVQIGVRLKSGGCRVLRLRSLPPLQCRRPIPPQPRALCLCLAPCTRGVHRVYTGCTPGVQGEHRRQPGVPPVSIPCTPLVHGFLMALRRLRMLGMRGVRLIPLRNRTRHESVAAPLPALSPFYGERVWSLDILDRSTRRVARR